MIDNTNLETVSGQVLDLANPDPRAIRIDDIVYALSNLPRFGGHAAQRDYTEAQHSLLIAKALAYVYGKDFHSYAHLRALFENGYRAYMGAITVPVSSLMDLKQPLLRLKQRLQSAVYSALCYSMGVPQGSITELLSQKYIDAISEARRWAYLYEANYLLRSGGAQVAQALENQETRDVKSPFSAWLVDKIKENDFQVLRPSIAYMELMSTHARLKEGFDAMRDRRKYK